MKKLFAVLLAVAMLLSLGVTAFASSFTGEIIVMDPPAGKTYTAYKIFDAATGPDGKVSYTTDTTWKGADKLFTVDETTKKVTMVNDAALTGLKIIPLDDSLTTFQVVKSTGFDAKKFAEYMSDKVSGGTASEVDTNSGDVKMAPLDPGYYLVKGSDNSLALTNVLENQTVKVQNKSDMPLDKDVQDENGTDINNQGVSVGDELHYTITTKVPTLDNDVTDYTFLITDTMTDGLTFGNKLIITIGGVPYTIEYFPATSNTVEGQEKIKVSGGGNITVDGVQVNPNDPASVAAAIASVNAAIAALDTEINGTLQTAVNDAQDAVDDAAQDLVDAKSDRDDAQALVDALVEAQRQNVYPVTVQSTPYADSAALAAAITAAQTALATAQTAVDDAETALSDAIDDLNDAVGAQEAKKTEKAQKEALLRRLQNIGEEGFTLVTSETDILVGDQVRFNKNGKTFELSLDMVARKDLAGEPVTIEYTATVNENAVAEILQNSAVLAFGEGSDIEYRDAETDNYTSQLIIDKFETGNRAQKLAGAEFELKAKDGDNANKYYRLTGKPVELDGNSADGLKHDETFPEKLVYKEVAEYIPYAVFVVDDEGVTHVAYVQEDANSNLISKNTKDAFGAYTAYYTDVKVEWVEYESMATKVRTDGEGRGVFAYLPDGTYDLIETKAPTDYIKLENPIEFTIDGHAATDKSLDKTQRIAALTKGVNVENTPGSSLPSTGGVGATLLTIGGVALMLAAGAYLILRRKEQE